MTRTARRLITTSVILYVLLISGEAALLLPIGHGADEREHQQYAAFLALRGRLPDMWSEDVRMAMHPPLYHALIGLYYRGLVSGHVPPGAVPDPDPLVLPFERHVALPMNDVIPDPIAESVAGCRVDGTPRPGSRTNWIHRSVLYWLRAPGVIFAGLCALLIMWAVTLPFGADRTLAILSGATVCLIPQFPLSFSTPNNDHFAVLFASGGFATLMAGMRGRDFIPRQWLLLSGLIFGLGFMSKTIVAGAFAAAAVLATLSGRASPWGRAQRLLLLCVGPLLCGGWWVVRQISETGSPTAVGVVAIHHPELIRLVRPDVPMGYLRDITMVFSTFLARAGARSLAPPTWWELPARSLQILFAFSIVAGLFSSQIGKAQRLLILSFIAGLATQLAILCYADQVYVITQGRYLQVLLLPGAVAFSASLPVLVGRHAVRISWVLAGVMAIGGFVMIHARIIPTYYSRQDVQSRRDLVAYIDLGSDPRDPRVTAPRLARVPAWDYPVPEGRMAATSDSNRPIRVHLADVSRTGAYVLSLRSQGLGDASPGGMLDSFTLRSRGRAWVGPISMHVGGWRSWPVPDRFIDPDGLVVECSLYAGRSAAISELALYKVPMRVVSKATGGRPGALEVVVDDDLVTPLQLRPILRDGKPREALPLIRVGPGRYRAELLEEHVPSKVSVSLSFGLRIVLDLKLAPFSRISDRRYSRTSPGYYVVRCDAGSPSSRLVAGLPAAATPAGRYQLRFLDAQGVDVTHRIAVSSGSARITSEGNILTLDVGPAHAESGGQLEIRYRGGETLLLDRIQGLQEMRTAVVLQADS